MKTKLISVLLFFIPLIAAKSYKTTGNSAITVSVKDFGAVGDGLHHDDTAIVKAIARLQSQGGGTLYFPTGWYRIVHSITKGEPEYVISIPDNISIQATGAVIGNTNDGAFCFRTTGQNISWTGGTIRKGGIEICSSYVTFTGLKSEYAWGHAFHLNSGKSNQSSDIHMLYRNITIQNCTALYPGRHGFALHRKNTVFGASDSAFLGEYLNIKFTNDSSFHAGTSLISPFDYGFGMENIVAATNVTFKNCFSYESQGAGFHVEYQIKTAGISYISSSAKRNGLSGRNGYPYGFMYRDAGFTISDCQTDSNYGGAYAMIPSFTGGQVNFVNSGERGFSKVSYNSNSTDNTKFVSNFAGYAVPACGTIYLGGDLTIPIKSLYTDLISIQKITELFADTNGILAKRAHYSAVTKKLVYDPTTRQTSIATQPIKADLTRQYQIKISMRVISGTKGSPYLYLQEFDKNCQLILHSGKRYTLQNVISGLSKDTVKTVNVNFGKGTSIPLNANTKWIRVSLCEAELSTDNRFYSLSEFSTIPL